MMMLIHTENAYELKDHRRGVTRYTDVCGSVSQHTSRPTRRQHEGQCRMLGRKQRPNLVHRDAATHLVMPPMEFMQRLAATVPITLSRSRGASASGCFAATNCCIRRPGSRVGQQRARC